MLRQPDPDPSVAELVRMIQDSAQTEAFCCENGWMVGVTLAPTVFGDRERQTMILTRSDRTGAVVCIGDGHMTAGEHASLLVWMEAVKAGLIP